MKKTALQIVIAILCLALTGCGTFHSKSKESLMQWVTENRKTWEKACFASNAGEAVIINRELADQWSGLFHDGRLDYVSFDPETRNCSFYFNGIRNLPEGDQYVVWTGQSMEEIAPVFPYDPGILEEKTDTRLYYTGIGSGGWGHVLVEQIEKNWYFVEYDFPT